MLLRAGAVRQRVNEMKVLMVSDIESDVAKCHRIAGELKTKAENASPSELHSRPTALRI